MAIYPSIDSYSACYVTTNNGQGIAAPVNLQGQRKVNSVSFSIGGAVSGFSWDGASCTGKGRNVRAGIWLTKPSSVLQSPDYLSTNVINTADQGRVSNSNRSDFRPTISTFYFNNVVCDRDEVWIGIASENWTTSNNSSDVVFATNSSYEGLYTAYTINWAWRSMAGHFSSSVKCIGIHSLSVQNPYTAPSYSISDVSPSIGTYNNTNFTVKYTISGGTNNIDWAIAKIYNSGDSHIASIDLSKSKGTNMTKSFKLPSACTDGQQYKVSVRFSDSHSEYETGKINIYTYRTPKVDNITMTETSFSRYRE